jgi:hypothetical protein
MYVYVCMCVCTCAEEAVWPDGGVGSVRIIEIPLHDLRIIHACRYVCAYTCVRNKYMCV